MMSNSRHSVARVLVLTLAVLISTTVLAESAGCRAEQACVMDCCCSMSMSASMSGEADDCGQTDCSIGGVDARADDGILIPSPPLLLEGRPAIAPFAVAPTPYRMSSVPSQDRSTTSLFLSHCSLLI